MADIIANEQHSNVSFTRQLSVISGKSSLLAAPIKCNSPQLFERLPQKPSQESGRNSRSRERSPRSPKSLGNWRNWKTGRKWKKIRSTIVLRSARSHMAKTSFKPILSIFHVENTLFSSLFNCIIRRNLKPNPKHSKSLELKHVCVVGHSSF